MIKLFKKLFNKKVQKKHPTTLLAYYSWLVENNEWYSLSNRTQKHIDNIVNREVIERVNKLEMFNDWLGEGDVFMEFSENALTEIGARLIELRKEKKK